MGQSPACTHFILPLGGVGTLGSELGCISKAPGGGFSVRPRLSTLFSAASSHHVQTTLHRSCVHPAAPRPGEQQWGPAARPSGGTKWVLGGECGGWGLDLVSRTLQGSSCHTQEADGPARRGRLLNPGRTGGLTAVPPSHQLRPAPPAKPLPELKPKQVRSLCHSGETPSCTHALPGPSMTRPCGVLGFLLELKSGDALRDAWWTPRVCVHLEALPAATISWCLLHEDSLFPF